MKRLKRLRKGGVNVAEDNIKNEDINEDIEDTVTDEATDNINAESTDDTDTASVEEAEVDDKKAAKKKDKKEKKDKKDQLIEELTDKYKRSFAEFDNFRKRTEKEKAAMYEIGAKDIVERILPVVDNFERGFAGLSEEQKSDPFVDGMDKVFKQLIKSLEEAGVKPIEAVGNEFDPNLHNAVMHIEDESFGENIVAEEFQKGYTYRDSVVRHSMVKVAN